MELKTGFFLLFIAALIVAVPYTVEKSSKPWFLVPNGDGSIVVADALGLTPEIEADVNKIHFYLWTRENPKTYDVLHVNDTSTITRSHFKSNRSTKVYVHGYADNGLTHLVLLNKNAYLQVEDCNVISVDWKYLARAPWYSSAVQNTVLVGNYTALLLDVLIHLGAQLESIHLVGFSLGAHVTGIAGYSLRSGKLNRITGLDVARPGFENKPLSERLDVSDADFVDVIHTNGGTFWEGCLGFAEPLGHVDFYPNGGQHQPGCGNHFIDMLHSCSHLKAPVFMALSIVTKSAKACPCNSWNDFQAGKCDCGSNYTLMGEYCPSSARGKFYLRIPTGVKKKRLGGKNRRKSLA